MHGLTLVFALISVLATLASADSHVHRVNHRGIHRRHHAREAVPPSASAQHKRRSCPVKPSTTASVTVSASSAPASSSTPESSSEASASSTEVPASSSEASVSSTKAETASASASASSSSASASHVSSAKFTSTLKSESAVATAKATSTPQSLSATGLIASLFPISQSLASWTTAQSSSAKSTTAIELADDALRVTRVLSGTSHTYMQWEGKSAMRAHYPKGSYNFQHSPRGGFSWYAYGPQSVDLTTAKEATLAYSAFFPKDFQFQLGGKMIGLYGGDSDEGSISCSGGSRNDACFSSRLMWRTPSGDGAKGELYTYLPPSFKANDAVCDVAPFSDCNPTYGASVGRGAFTLPTGQWITLAQRVRLNDVNQENGQIEVFVNGKSVISVSGLVLRQSSAGRIRGLIGQTFFGGSKPEWASPKDQDAYFADFSVAITETL